MKKLLILALAAIFAVTAQAITLTWGTDAKGRQGFLNDKGQVCGFKPTNNFHIIFEFSNLTKVSAEKALVQISSSTDPNISVGFKANGDNWGALGKATYLIPNNGTRETGGDFSANRMNGTTTLKLKFTDKKNGKYTWFSVDEAFADGTVMNGQLGGAASFDFGDVLLFDTIDGNALKNTTIKLDTLGEGNEIVVLPEPTVLALLALGVAGLALKRKVA